MEKQLKPKSTWQVYYPAIKKLQVHETESLDSRVVFYGNPEDYSGFATEPASPTPEYEKKHAK